MSGGGLEQGESRQGLAPTATAPEWRPRAARWAVRLAGVAWTLSWLWTAFGRWRYERMVSWMYGPFPPVEVWDHIRRASDWKTPLCLALVPATIWLVSKAWRSAQALRLRRR